MSQTRSIPLSFVNHLQQVHFKKNEVEQEDIMSLLDRFRVLNSFPFSAMPAFYVIDYTRRDYMLMSEAIRNIAFFHPEDFMDSGLSMLLDIYDKDDFKVYNQKIFTANANFLQSVPQAERDSYVFSYTFRVRNGKGATCHVYQRGNYITNEKGELLYSLGMVMNATGLYNQRIMYHSIEKAANGYPGEQQLIQQNYFYPYEEDTILSEREKTVVGYMAEGLSIKQIAHKLNITVNTVANHRKNMFRKTGTNNMAALIAFVIRNRII